MILQIKETCLYVQDLEETRKFYQEKLGLPVIGRSEGRHIFFRAGSSVLLCFIAEVTSQDQTLPPHYGTGNLHLAFEVDKPEYNSWKEKIKSAGIQIIQEYDWGKGLQSFYFKDPDNHVLEIVPKGLWDY